MDCAAECAPSAFAVNMIQFLAAIRTLHDRLSPCFRLIKKPCMKSQGFLNNPGIPHDKLNVRPRIFIGIMRDKTD